MSSFALAFSREKRTAVGSRRGACLAKKAMQSLTEKSSDGENMGDGENIIPSPPSPPHRATRCGNKPAALNTLIRFYQSHLITLKVFVKCCHYHDISLWFTWSYVIYVIVLLFLLIVYHACLISVFFPCSFCLYYLCLVLLRGKRTSVCIGRTVRPAKRKTKPCLTETSSNEDDIQRPSSPPAQRRKTTRSVHGQVVNLILLR